MTRAGWIVLAVLGGLVVVGGAVYFVTRRSVSTVGAGTGGFDISGLLARMSGGAVTGTSRVAGTNVATKGPATFAGSPPADATFSLEEAGIA